MEAVLRNTIRDTLVREFRQDQRIRAIWIGGSVGRGEEDLYSDLDFYVAVDDEKFEEVFEEIPNRMDLLYPLLHYTDFAFRRSSPTERVWFFYLQEFPVYFRIDFHVHTVSSAKGADPDQRRELIYREWEVVTDPNNLLSPLPPVPLPEEAELKAHLQEKVDTVAWIFVLMGNYIRRDRFWQAAEHLAAMRSHVLYFMAVVKDPSHYNDSYERRLRKALSGAELAVLDNLRFGADRFSQMEVAHQLLNLFQGAASLLCKRYNLQYPEGFLQRVQAMYSEMKKEDV